MLQKRRGAPQYVALRYDLMEIARIGALYIPGDVLEEVMPPERHEYPKLAVKGGKFALGDEIDFAEGPFNTLKRLLLLTERIDEGRRTATALWIRRPEDPGSVEVMVAGRALPQEGYGILPIWPEIARAFAGRPTRLRRPDGETVYYPIRNSDEEIVGVLEGSEPKEVFFI
mgnify:CR=1 FL=1